MVGPCWGRHSTSLAPGGSGAWGAAERGHEAGHGTQAKPSFLQDKRQCKLASVSESWCYRRSDSSCGDVQVSLMGFGH